MSIFLELHKAAEAAHQYGDPALERECDLANVVLGEALRSVQEEMTTESFQVLVAAWTQAILLLDKKPRRVA